MSLSNAPNQADPADAPPQVLPRGGKRPADTGISRLLEVRRALPQEIRPALRLVLGPGGRPAGEAAVGDFVRFAGHRQIDLSQMQVVRVGKRIGFAAIALASPGGTSLVMCPPQLGLGVSEEAAAEAIEQVTAQQALLGATLAQSLVAPRARDVQGVLQRCGYGAVAVLIYLRRKVDSGGAHGPPRAPAGYRLESYTPGAYLRLAGTIKRSYIDSQDCPALGGMRSINDTIATHRTAGMHRDDWWHLLVRQADNEPVGVLLLAGIGQRAGEGIELVYLGLAPEARGRGLGDFLLKQAVFTASLTPGRALILACDAQNKPALALYRRHGLRSMQRRLAMLRNLRGAARVRAAALCSAGTSDS